MCPRIRRGADFYKTILATAPPSIIARVMEVFIVQNLIIIRLFFPDSFVDDQKIIVILQGQIALFVTKTIFRTFLGFINTGEVVKIETLIGEFLFVHFGFFGNIQFLKNAVVLAKNAVYITNQICGVAVQFVVVCIATHIGTEFFINSSAEFFVAFEAFAFFSHEMRC
jgi:hypothetical protein